MPVSESNPSGSNPLIPKGHTYNVPLTVGVRSCCKKRFDNSQDGNKLGDDCCSIKSQCALFECVSCVWVVTGEHCCKTCSKIMCSECCDVLEVYECGNCRFLTPGSDDLVPPQPQSGNVPSPGNFLMSALWQTLCCVCYSRACKKVIKRKVGLFVCFFNTLVDMRRAVPSVTQRSTVSRRSSASRRSCAYVVLGASRRAFLFVHLQTTFTNLSVCLYHCVRTAPPT